MNKNIYRKRQIELRKTILDKEEKSNQITVKIINHPKYKEANVVACYCALNDEVNLDKVILDAIEKKKKVIVPIIIGVVVLIAIVVGITYAYFEANNTASGTTNLDVSAEKVGTVIVQNPTENLYLKLSAYEMQESLAGETYYATATNGTGASVYSSEAEDNVLANYTISGGEEDTIYNCTSIDAPASQLSIHARTINACIIRIQKLVPICEKPISINKWCR